MEAARRGYSTNVCFFICGNLVSLLSVPALVSGDETYSKFDWQKERANLRNIFIIRWRTGVRRGKLCTLSKKRAHVLSLKV